MCGSFIGFSRCGGGLCRPRVLASQLLFQGLTEDDARALPVSFESLYIAHLFTGPIECRIGLLSHPNKCQGTLSTELWTGCGDYHSSQVVCCQYLHCGCGYDKARRPNCGAPSAWSGGNSSQVSFKSQQWHLHGISVQQGDAFTVRLQQVRQASCASALLPGHVERDFGKAE